MFLRRTVENYPLIIIKYPHYLFHCSPYFWWHCIVIEPRHEKGERGGSVVECRTPEREVRGSRPTSAVLCPWARHFTPRKYWLITQEAMAPSRHDWKIVDLDVKPQHNQPTNVMRKPVFTTYANNKGPGQPAHPRSLICTFVVHCLDGIIPLVSIPKISSL